MFFIGEMAAVHCVAFVVRVLVVSVAFVVGVCVYGIVGYTAVGGWL